MFFFCGGSYFDWFPIRGIVSDNFDFYSPVGKFLDYLHHMALPTFCYTLGEFAVMTMLVKNSLLEEIKKDYIRTLIVKDLH